jgi:hypothetical protein
MIRLIATAVAAVWLAFAAVPGAQAQGCGPSNPNCIMPTAPNGTSDKRGATTEFVQKAFAGGSSLPPIATGSVLGNTSGSTASPTAQPIIPWSAPFHDGSGGTSAGHNLVWADLPPSFTADYFDMASGNPSLLYALTIAGAPAAGNTVTVNFTFSGVLTQLVYTVQSGDVANVIAQNISNCMRGITSTGASGCAAVLAAYKAFLSADGIGQVPTSGGATAGKFVFDFPWGSTNNLTTSVTGGVTSTLSSTFANATLDNGPVFICGRQVPGRTPLAGDQLCDMQWSTASGPSTGYDTTYFQLGSEYRGGGVLTAHARSFIASVSGNGNNALQNIYFGPKGVYLPKTDGSGGGCGGFTADSTTADDPGYGNFSACGQIFAGAGQIGAAFDPATRAMNETIGVLRVSGNAQQPSAGSGLEMNFHSGISQILSFNETGTAYLPLQIFGSNVFMQAPGSPGATSNLTTSGIDLNLNATASPGFAINGIHLTSLDGAQIGYGLNDFGGTPLNVFQRADNTNASPTAVQTNDGLGGIRFDGYSASVSGGGAGYYTGAARILALVGSNFSGTNSETGLVFNVTGPSQTSGSTKFKMWGSGGYAVGATIAAGSDPGAGFVSVDSGYKLTSLWSSTTAPTISAGFCSSPSVSNNNGTASFEITVGSACGAGTGTITLPSAAHKWTCSFVDVTTPNTHVIRQTGGSATTVTVQDYSGTTGATQNMVASDVIQAQCAGY